MAKRHPNHRRVKLHRNYTVEEIASLLFVHKNTVREWVKLGLPVIDNKRPMLILGQELAAFLQARRIKNKRTCHPERCTASVAELRKCLLVTWRIIFLKPKNWECSRRSARTATAIMNRRVSMAKLGQIRGKIAITFPQGLDQVSNRTHPTVNSDLERRDEPMSKNNPA